MTKRIASLMGLALLAVTASAQIMINLPQNVGNQTLVRFQRHGNQWVLQSITLAGTQAEVLPSKLEKELMSRKRSDTRTLVAHLER